MTKYIIGVLVLLLAGVCGLAVWYRGNAAIAKRNEDVQKVVADVAKAQVKALTGVVDFERNQAKSVNQVSEDLENRRAAAETLPNTVVSDLRAGTIKLRKQWASCESARMSEAGAAARERDEEAKRREEFAARVVRIGRDSDDQLAACQALVLTYTQQ